MKIKEVFKNYLKERIFYAILLALIFIIFACVYFAYHIKQEAYLYALYLTCFVIVIFTIIDFYHYYQKHLELSRLHQSISYTHHLPSSSTFHEKEYQALITELKKAHNENSLHYEQAIDDLENYFTVWAHQMKLPIASMKLLLETENTPDKKLLKSELLRINQYTDMILAYLRLTSQDTDYVFTKVPLDPLIRQTIRKFSTEFILKNINMDFEETNMIVLIDEKWLAFVLEQLLSNALKYTQQGSIHIYGKDFTLFIEDTGIGIESYDLPRIFEKGFTGINGRIDKKASGLGLYLCKTILDKLSCSIEIQSQVNQGTKVILHLEHENVRVE